MTNEHEPDWDIKDWEIKDLDAECEANKCFIEEFENIVAKSRETLEKREMANAAKSKWRWWLAFKEALLLLVCLALLYGVYAVDTRLADLQPPVVTITNDGITQADIAKLVGAVQARDKEHALLEGNWRMQNALLAQYKAEIAKLRKKRHGLKKKHPKKRH